MRPLKILYPFSFLYLLFFNISQKIKKRRQKKLHCRVISVGNITVGGTGKTPTVIYLAELLKSLNKKVCVISRGYKSQFPTSSTGTSCGRNFQLPSLVSDGKKIFLGPKIAGDEPYLIAKSLGGVPVLVDTDRYRAGLFAMEEFGTDTAILDDGFQHLNLFRDIDIVCINALNPFGNNLLLPAGYLREPVKNISRASAFVVTRCDKVPDKKIQMIDSVIRKYNEKGPIFHAFFSKRIFNKHSTEIALSSIRDKNVMAISGIAVPEDFETTITEMGMRLLVHRKYPDHYFFKDKDIKRFYNDAAEFQSIIITTSKDATRLPEDLPCYILDIKLGIQEKNEMTEFLEVHTGKKT